MWKRSARASRGLIAVRSVARARPSKRQRPWPPSRRRSALHQVPTLLVIIDGPLAGSSVPLTGNTITLGRSASNTVVLDDEFVSSHHARVYTDPATGKWAVEDLGSTNGTVVNQQRLNAPMILGTRIPVRIGATTFELR